MLDIFIIKNTYIKIIFNNYISEKQNIFVLV